MSSLSTKKEYEKTMKENFEQRRWTNSVPQTYKTFSSFFWLIFYVFYDIINDIVLV